MTTISRQDQITALFVMGIYFWLIDDQFNADNAIAVACLTLTAPFGNA